MFCRIVLVDQQTAFRELLASRLAGESERYCVRGESSECAEALELCRKQSADLLIIDCLPGENAFLSEVGSLARQLPELRILLVTDARDGLRRALASGAHGCVLKEEPVEQILLGIKVVCGGDNYFSPFFRSRLARVSCRLTARQLEILVLIAGGHSTKEVAARLNISYKTADSHRSRLMKKLNLHDLTAVVRFAIRHGHLAA